jgi:hypothetical protein
MITFKESTVIKLVESLELVVIDYSQDKYSDPSICKTIQLIPVLAINIITYEQSYRDSSSVDLITETRYISPKGEIDLEKYVMIQQVRPDNTLACISVIALRAKGSNQVCLLEPSREKSWLRNCSLTVNPDLYTTYSSGEDHPTIVNIEKLQHDIEFTFSAITNFDGEIKGVTS